MSSSLHSSFLQEGDVSYHTELKHRMDATLLDSSPEHVGLCLFSSSLENIDEFAENPSTARGLY